MSEGEGAEWVRCPKCGARIEEPWSFNLDPDRWTHVWCPECDASFEMRDVVTHLYEVRDRRRA